MPATSVSRTGSKTPAWRSTSGSLVRVCAHRRRPVAASKALTERSAPSTNTRQPATSGGVNTCVPRRWRHSSLPPSSTTSWLSCVTTAVHLPSLPTPADSGVCKSVRQMSPPVRPSSAATVPSRAASVTTWPLTCASSGKPSTLPMRAVHDWRTASTGTLGPSSAGFCLALLPIPSHEQALSTALSTSRSAGRTKALALIVMSVPLWLLGWVPKPRSLLSLRAPHPGPAA